MIAGCRDRDMSDPFFEHDLAHGWRNRIVAARKRLNAIATGAERLPARSRRDAARMRRAAANTGGAGTGAKSATANQTGD